jgi:hypothetical protein
VLLSQISRGINKGYSSLKILINNSDLLNNNDRLPYLYGQIIAKQREYLQKEQGFHVFKLYKQRLFSTMYPLLIEKVKTGD